MPHARTAALALALTIALSGCGGDGDHGSTNTHGSMPADHGAGSTAGDHGAMPMGSIPGRAPGTLAPIPEGADHNTQDVTFARDMVPHHAQAVGMSELASSRAADPRVKDLAGRIKAAQDPEIDQLQSWLREWGQPGPDAAMMAELRRSGMSPMGGMPDMPDMPGMMSADDMHALMAATGAAFDRLFLEQMIEHHEGAIAMARTEQSEGRHRPAISLAGTIIATQTAEIAEMRAILG